MMNPMNVRHPSRGRRWSALLALVAALLLAPRAQADTHPNFDGVWVLDLEASQPLEPILTAQGRSWAERKLADSVVVTQAMKVTADQLIVDISTPVSERQEILPLDGVARPTQTEHAGTVYTRTFWAEDGQVLVSVTQLTLPDGAPAEMVATRRIKDGGATMEQLLELKLSDGRVLKSNRVLRKR